ncbi:MAG: hypothetical protein JNL79_36015 [Myxococcales bacterium]|nr:hypothetical protein [Myxococcales bacterium]
MRGRWISGMALAALLASHAHAETDPAGAQVLFDEGQKLVASGDYPSACPKFAASHRLEPAIGTLINLADCYEHVGKLASAWARYLDAATMAERAGQPARAKKAREHAKALEPRLCKLIIVVEGVGYAEVRRDEFVIEPAAYGLAVPIDPGRHVVRATGPAVAPFEAAIDVEGEGQVVRVVVKPSAAAAPAEPPVAGRSQRLVAFVMGGLGVVSLGVAAGFGLRARSKWGEAQGDCVGTVCGSRGVALAAEANRAAGLADIGLVVGGVAVAAGVVLFFTAPKGAPPASARLYPLLGRDAVGVGLVGAF